MTARPSPLDSRLDLIPAELAERPQWVAWMREVRDGTSTKVPYKATPTRSERARSDDPETWASFDAARAARSWADGIGYILAEGDPYTGVDLDHCRDPETGVLEPWAASVILRLDSYTEASVSGGGVHILVRASKPGARCRTGQVEMYDSKRMLCMTGEHVVGVPTTIEDRQAELTAWYAEVFPPRVVEPSRPASNGSLDISYHELLERGFDSLHGPDIRDLWEGRWEGRYPSHSEADMALCSHLSFWTNHDPARVDSLFRQSGLMRAKWDREDYRTWTLDRATSGGDGYTPSGDPRTSRGGTPPLAAPAASRARLRLYTPGELLNLPDPEWLVEPFLISGCISILFGPSGTYKSFMALDWAARAPGLAVYISAEGSPKKLGERINGWETAAGSRASIRCIPQSLNLLGEEAGLLADALRDLAEPIRLLIVDTAARNMAGDENLTRDMSLLIAALDQLRAEFGCAVLVIHHTGHDNTDRERGSSALRGAADVSIRAKKEAPLQVRLECAKMRDAEMFPASAVRLQPLGGTLVATEVVNVRDHVRRLVEAYLAEHPGASQNEVEAAVPGRSAVIRDAYQQHKQGASRASNPMDAPQRKVRPAAVPLKGTRDAPPLPLEDGGF